MTYLHKPIRSSRRGFTLLELQVAIILLAFGIVTLSSLLATQTRLLKRVQGDFQSGAMLYVTQSNDPWVRKLTAAARVTKEPITQAAAPIVQAENDVTIVAQEHDLNAESMTVTVDVSPIP